MIKKENKSLKLYPTDFNLSMANSLSNLINNLVEKIHEKLNVDTDTMVKNMKLAELNAKVASAVLNTQTLTLFQLGWGKFTPPPKLFFITFFNLC